jgi:hypothetical protein
VFRIHMDPPRYHEFPKKKTLFQTDSDSQLFKKDFLHMLEGTGTVLSFYNFVKFSFKFKPNR